MMKKSKHIGSKSHTPNDTLISYGTTMEGSISVPSNLRIDGSYHGDIACEGTIVIGEQGEVHANVQAKDVIISGLVHGDIQCNGKLTVTATGILNGNCQARWLIIQEGGILNGRSMTERSEQLQKSTSKSQASSTAHAEESASNHKRNEKQAG